MAAETRKRVGAHERIDDGATYVVIGTAKDQADATREVFRGSWDHADGYVERNTSPDNFERYHLERVLPPVLEKVDIPERVWLDTLDPLCSGMQADLELGEPELVRRGKGGTRRYRDVPVATALDLAEYVGGRGEMLLAQGAEGMGDDPVVKAERDCYRAAVKVAARIRQQVEALESGRQPSSPRRSSGKRKPSKPSGGVQVGDVLPGEGTVTGVGAEGVVVDNGRKWLAHSHVAQLRKAVTS